MLVEKTSLLSFLAEGTRKLSFHLSLVAALKEVLLNTGNASCCPVSEEARRGYIFFPATIAATIQVNMNGREEKKIVEGGTESRRRWRWEEYEGTQSSQSSVGNIVV
jgi:hypothetical protein